MARGAGLLLKVRGERRFLPAILVQSVVPTPRLSDVPGSALRLALIAGRVLPVLELGAPGAELVVCLAEGETVALAGVEVQDAGAFQPEGEGVSVDGISIPPLDVGAELLRVAPRPSRPPREGAAP
jgi:hypothetical protein